MTRSLLAAALALLCLALPVSIAGTNLALFAVTLALLSSRRVSWKALKNPAFYAVLAYCATAVVVSLLGIDLSISMGMLYKDFHKAWTLGLLLTVLCSEPSPAAFAPLAAGFSFVVAVGLWQTATQKVGPGAAPWVRAHAFVHAVTYGEQLGLAWLGAVCFLRAEVGERARKTAIAFLVATSAALVLNQTRGALLGVAAGFTALCWLDKPLRRRAAWGALGGAGVVGAWEVMPTGGRSLADLFRHFKLWSSSGVASPFTARMDLWKVALRAFRDHPWTGVGPGNYRTAFTRYFQGDIEGERVWGSAHNLYLHQLSERGLLGAVALAALLATLTALSWRRARARPNAWNLWAAAATIAFLVMNLTEVAFQNEQLASLVLFIWAWGQANAARAPGEKIL